MWGMPEKVVLGFDFGMKRIGVALGNILMNHARPLETLAAKNGVPAWDRVACLIREWHADLLIVGIPLNLEGKEQNITLEARFFAQSLQARFELPVDLVDERLTTVEARQRLFDRGGYSHLVKSEVDAYAAEIIVEQWLAEHARCEL